MRLDTSLVGRSLPQAELQVERGRLALFCEAIGETDPVYTDVVAARAAGHRDIPVPPTYLCAIQHERPEPFGWLQTLGIDLSQVMHGEQTFTYHAMAYAGDHLRFRPRIHDVYAKKYGALEFIVRDAEVTRDDGSPVADLRDIVVITNPEATS